MNPLTQLIHLLNSEWEKEIYLKRGDFLVSKGDKNANLYFVKEGSLRVFIDDEIEEHTIRFGYKDSIITALDYFLTENPTDFYIQALKKTSLKFISKEKFNQLRLNNKDFESVWLKLLESFVHQQMEREVDLITYSPQKRFERVLKRSPQVFQEIPHKYIASYLRMTPETLSRILKTVDLNQDLD